MEVLYNVMNVRQYDKSVCLPSYFIYMLGTVGVNESQIRI